MRFGIYLYEGSQKDDNLTKNIPRPSFVLNNLFRCVHVIVLCSSETHSNKSPDFPDFSDHETL